MHLGCATVRFSRILAAKRRTAVSATAAAADIVLMFAVRSTTTTAGTAMMIGRRCIRTATQRRQRDVREIAIIFDRIAIAVRVVVIIAAAAIVVRVAGRPIGDARPLVMAFVGVHIIGGVRMLGLMVRGGRFVRRTFGIGDF